MIYPTPFMLFQFQLKHYPELIIKAKERGDKKAEIFNRIELKKLIYCNKKLLN